MLINRDHRRWAAATGAITAALALLYAAALAGRPAGPSGGSSAGLAFGVAGTGCMLIAGALSLRKRVRTWRLGSAEAWMRMHLWLGLLAVPCIWFHSGFAVGGALTTLIMVLFYTVIASGIVGVILQQVIPAAMTRRVPLETIHGQIEHVISALAVDAYEIIASLIGPIAEAADEQQALAAEEQRLQQQPRYWKQVPRLRPAASSPAGAEELRVFYLTAVRPYLQSARRQGAPDFRSVMLRASEEWRGKLERLQALCDEARQLAVQRRLHRTLHGWLFVHAPLSLALFVLVAVHIVFALRY